MINSFNFLLCESVVISSLPLLKGIFTGYRILSEQFTFSTFEKHVIIPKDISPMSVWFPSLRFPSPTPIWARSCLVHVKQEGILEVLRATGIQHLLVPLHVLSDKSFTS